MNNDLIVSGMKGKQLGILSPLNFKLQIWRTNLQSSERDSHQRREGGRGKILLTKARVGPTLPVVPIQSFHCLVDGIMSM